MLWVGRDLVRSSSPTPCSEQGHLPLDQVAQSPLVLHVSRDGASTTSLGNPCQYFTTLTVRNFFLVSSLNLPSLSLKPFPCPMMNRNRCEKGEEQNIVTCEDLGWRLEQKTVSHQVGSTFTAEAMGRALPLPAPADSCSRFRCLCCQLLTRVLAPASSSRAARERSSRLHKPALQGGRPQISEGMKAASVNVQFGRAAIDLS